MHIKTFHYVQCVVKWETQTSKHLLNTNKLEFRQVIFGFNMEKVDK